MSDPTHPDAAIPGWFRIAAIAAILWELIGCAVYLFEVTLDPASLPLDQRAIVAAMPSWLYASFAIAVWVGLAGAVQLLRRRRSAGPLLLVSLMFTVVTQAGPLIDPQLRALMTSDAMFLPFVVVVGCYAVWQLARLAGRRGWLQS